MIHSLIAWIESTAMSQGVQTIFWIIPTVQTIHILSVSVVMASMAMLDLRLLGIAGRSHSIESLANRFMPWAWSAIGVLLLTGLVLIIGEPGRSLGNWVFQLKMSLLALAIISSLILMHRRPSSASGLRALGALLLALWVSIVVCGRWIAYVGT